MFTAAITRMCVQDGNCHWVAVRRGVKHHGHLLELRGHLLASSCPSMKVNDEFTFVAFFYSCQLILWRDGYCRPGPYHMGEDVLSPSAEASNGPNAHPRINCKVTKSPSAVHTCVHTNTWNHPPPKWGPTHLDLPTNMHSWYLQENISLKAHKHFHPGHHDQQDSKPEKSRRPISKSSIKPQNPPSATLTWVNSKIGITST